MRVGSPGSWLQLVGVVHALYGAVKHRHVLTAMTREGLVATVPDDGERATALWFLLLAPVCWVAGRGLASVEVSGDTATLRQAGSVLAITGLVGAVVHPRSPLSTVAAIGVASVLLARRSDADR